MKTNKIGTIFLVSVLALAGVGISYAGWIDQISITGTVQTGYVGFEVVEYSGTWVWKNIPNHDIETHHGIPIDYDGDGEIDDDPNGYYGNADWKLIAYSYAHNFIPDEDVQFEFVNLFPCIDFHADFKFTIGTIPVILESATLDWSNEKIDDVATEWLNGLPNAPSPKVEVTITYTDDAGNTIEIYPGTTDIIQLHPGVIYTWDLLIHIPQYNGYMNAYAEASGGLKIVQWSDLCEEEELGKTINIPGSGTMQVSYPSTAGYFDVTISNTGYEFGDGYNLYNGGWIGWCVDQENTIGFGTYAVEFYSSLDPYVYTTLAPGHDENTPDGIGGITPWDCINYIINHKGAHDIYSIQLAIWYYVDGGHYPDDAANYNTPPDASQLLEAQSIITEVEDNVANWLADGFPRSVPGYNWFAVVCYIDDNTQLTFIEVDP